MKTIKNTLTVLIIIFVTSMINAQVGTEKEKSVDNNAKSSWDNILSNSNDEYESVVFGECVSGNCENGYGKREKNIGTDYNETFEGNYKNGQLNGQGTHIKFNDYLTIAVDGYAKMKYVGNWEDNQKDGQGVETRYDENNKVLYKYVGDWKNDKKNGIGKEYVNGALVYDGKFKNGFHFKDSGCITGDCKNGYGVFIYPNKNKYIGEYKDGLKNGFGIEVDPKGNYIYGNWKNNKEDGYVRIFNKNNEIIFAGEMMSGKPVQKITASGEEYGCTIGNCTDGFGHYYFESGSKYIGEWKDGVQHGFGTTIWADSSKYVGQYYEGEIDGYGTQYDANGQLIRKGKYVGNSFIAGSGESTEKGKCTFGNCGNGFGILVVELESEWKRGYEEVKNDFDSKYEGIWVYEFKNEIGFLEDKHGNTYVGQFKKDEYEGQGVATFANGDKYNGSFEDGAINGFGTMTYADGSKYVGEWSYNDKEGKGKEYDKHGKLIYSGEYYNNERDD